MTPERPALRRTALIPGLLATCLLAACGSGGDPGTQRAATTTATSGASTGDAVATTPARSSTSRAAPAGQAGAPGVGDAISTPPPQSSSSRAAAADRAGTPRFVDAVATSAAVDGADPCANATAPPAQSAAAGDPAAASASTTSTSTAMPTGGTAPGGIAPSADEVTLARPFASTSPWNTPIDARAVDPRSNAWIARASRRPAVVAARGGGGVTTTSRRARDLRLYVNTCAWTPTIVGVGGGREVRFVCRQRDCGPAAKELRTLNVPTGLDPLPQFDGWYSVIDESAGLGYDLWRARRGGDVISYHFIKRWPLDGPGYSPPATVDPVAAVGARGSGLPLFAGVVQPDELRDGRIDHALAISVPGPAQGIFTPPASVTNGVNVVDSLPEGSRLRLKAGFVPGAPPRGANRRSVDALVTALRTYGAIVVDRSIVPTLYARRSSGYGSLLRGNELRGIRLSDLEVVRSGPLLRFPPLDRAPQAVRG